MIIWNICNSQRLHGCPGITYIPKVTQIFNGYLEIYVTPGDYINIQSYIKFK